MMPQKYHEVETGSTKSELHNEQPNKRPGRKRGPSTINKQWVCRADRDSPSNVAELAELLKKYRSLTVPAGSPCASLRNTLQEHRSARDTTGRSAWGLVCEPAQGQPARVDRKLKCGAFSGSGNEAKFRRYAAVRRQ
jgi:hypothetical protein